MDDKNKQLYEAGVSFLVSQTTATDAWAYVAKWTDSKRGTSDEEVEAAFKEVEEQIKKDYAITKMPSAWRSAKTVALKAYKQSISLIATDGEPLGKTQVERLCKAPVLPKAVGFDAVHQHLIEVRSILNVSTGIAKNALRAEYDYINAIILPLLKAQIDAKSY